MATLVSSFFVFLFCIFLTVQASPAALFRKAALDVFVPQIIEPNSQTTWTIGKNATIVWDTTNAPKTISNGASVILNHHGGVLAQGFDLRAGCVNITVPDVPQGPYFITLFGDSGNYSPVFTIAS
ncbi:hypothetical protein B0H34DRAFT_795319 [Crassisporium funariophilum]|nr:hypothetical protein B0H34DRAFT_795319 [Crassisporium funariophilum]